MAQQGVIPTPSPTPSQSVRNSIARVTVHDVDDFLNSLVTDMQSQLPILDQLYNAVGVTSEERSFLLSEMLIHIRTIIVSHCNDTAAMERELAAAIDAATIDIADLAKALDESAALNELRLITASSAEKGLRPRAHVHAQLANSLRELKTLRQNVLTNALDKLRGYYDHLGIDSAEWIDEFAPARQADLSQKRIETLNRECERLVAIKQSRIVTVASLATSILTLCAELDIVADNFTIALAQLNLHDIDDPVNAVSMDASVIADLQQRLSVIQAERNNRQSSIHQFQQHINVLWDTLNVDAAHRSSFLRQVNNQLTTAAIDRYQSEVNSLHILKAERMQSIIVELRNDISALWTKLRYTQQQTQSFTAFHSATYDDATLEAHVAEKARLNAILQSIQSLLLKIEQREEWRHQLAEFELSSSDPSRLKSQRGGHLVLAHEERMRKLQKSLPIHEQRLIQSISEWEIEHQSEFCVNGERYIDKIRFDEEEDKEKAMAKRMFAESVKEERQSVYKEKGSGPRVVTPLTVTKPSRTVIPAASVVTPVRPAASGRSRADGTPRSENAPSIKTSAIPPAIAEHSLSTKSTGKVPSIRQPGTPNMLSSSIKNKENHGTL